MKHSNLTFIAALLIAAFAPVFQVVAQDHPFQTGEKLTYKLRYKLGVINADIANLEFNIQGHRL